MFAATPVIDMMGARCVNHAHGGVMTQEAKPDEAASARMMRSLVRVVCALVLLLAATAAGGQAQQTDPPGVGEFVKSFVEAVNSKSLERRKALLHPKSVTCPGADLLEEIFVRQVKRAVSEGYKWRITPIPPGQPLLFSDKLDYPIRPSHRLQIDFETGQTKTTTMILQVVHDADQWREVMPCPKPDTIVAARAAREARVKQEQRVQELVAGTAPELKAAVLRLFKEGRRIEAYKHYASVSGEDLAVAREVVERLAEP
jgi:hypothetical protein